MKQLLLLLLSGLLACSTSKDSLVKETQNELSKSPSVAPLPLPEELRGQLPKELVYLQRMTWAKIFRQGHIFAENMALQQFRHGLHLATGMSAGGRHAFDKMDHDRPIWVAVGMPLSGPNRLWMEKGYAFNPEYFVPPSFRAFFPAEDPEAVKEALLRECRQHCDQLSFEVIPGYLRVAGPMVAPGTRVKFEALQNLSSEEEEALGKNPIFRALLSEDVVIGKYVDSLKSNQLDALLNLMGAHLSEPNRGWASASPARLFTPAETSEFTYRIVAGEKGWVHDWYRSKTPLGHALSKKSEFAAELPEILLDKPALEFEWSGDPTPAHLGEDRFSPFGVLGAFSIDEAPETWLKAPLASLASLAYADLFGIKVPVMRGAGIKALRLKSALDATGKWRTIAVALLEDDDSVETRRARLAWASKLGSFGARYEHILPDSDGRFLVVHSHKEEDLTSVLGPLSKVSATPRGRLDTSFWTRKNPDAPHQPGAPLKVSRLGKAPETQGPQLSFAVHTFPGGSVFRVVYGEAEQSAPQWEGEVGSGQSPECEEQILFSQGQLIKLLDLRSMRRDSPVKELEALGQKTRTLSLIQEHLAEPLSVCPSDPNLAQSWKSLWDLVTQDRLARPTFGIREICQVEELCPVPDGTLTPKAVRLRMHCLASEFPASRVTQLLDALEKAPPESHRVLLEREMKIEGITECSAFRGFQID